MTDPERAACDQPEHALTLRAAGDHARATDGPCPAFGNRHVCCSDWPDHQMHVCACSLTWNGDGLTFTEWNRLTNAGEAS